MIKRLFLLVSLLFILIPAVHVYAQESGLPSDEQVEQAKPNYELAYPGILPDHPLYFIKAGRDRIISFFISQPIKKAEFNLLQADKRIHASLLLSEKREDKIGLAQSTFSKGENYFEMAINNTEEAKRQGIDITEFSKKLSDANEKHQQVLNDMLKKQNENSKKKFSVEAKRLIDFDKRIVKLANNK